MDERILKPLAKRLKCAYLSYHLGISLAYCMKRYVDDYEIEEYWYEMADIIWRDNHANRNNSFACTPSTNGRTWVEGLVQFW